MISKVKIKLTVHPFIQLQFEVHISVASRNQKVNCLEIKINARRKLCIESDLEKNKGGLFLFKDNHQACPLHSFS